MKLENKKMWVDFLYCFVIAFAVLLLCSRSSFLYPCNNWDDANSYFSMGKAMFHGKVLYRDVMDQKGPYLYLLYGIAYLISHNTFLGVFLLEIVAATFFLHSCLLGMNLFLPKRLSLGLLPILAACAYSSMSFYWGGSAEEFCLPYFGYSLYMLLRHYQMPEEQNICRRDIFVVGILTGIVALVKYNSLGFFAAWMTVPVLKRLFQVQWKEMFKDIGSFIIGMMVPFIPWFIYFICNHALFYWYQGYIFYNVFVYSDFADESLTLYGRFYNLAKILYWLILQNFQYFGFIIVGVLGMILTKKICWEEKIGLALLCFLTFFGIFVGGANLKYYSVPLIVFSMLGFIVFGRIVLNLLKYLRGLSFNIFLYYSVLGSIIIGSLLFANYRSMNTAYRKTTREDSYLYQLANCIPKSDDVTMLNIGCLDAGLYTVADIIPNCRWFQTQPIPWDEVGQEQERYIRERQIDYILARDIQPQYLEQSGYHLIKELPAWVHEELPVVFYLYQKN